MIRKGNKSQKQNKTQKILMCFTMEEITMQLVLLKIIVQ